MKILLDTHALLWALSNVENLSEQAREQIGSESSIVFVSVASLWELSIKEAINKIKLPKNFYQKLQPAGFEILPINLEHIQTLKKLPQHHRDPFDRMLIAQAQHEQMTFITRDENIKKYKVNILAA